MTDYSALISKAEKDGTVEVQPGVYLTIQTDLIAEQQEWDDGDSAKNTDLTTAPFWITTDNGIGPLAIHTAADLAVELD